MVAIPAGITVRSWPATGAAAALPAAGARPAAHVKASASIKLTQEWLGWHRRQSHGPGGHELGPIVNEDSICGTEA